MRASLRIVCVNDVYSLENLPRLRSLVREQASTDPADLLLVTMAGDFLAPSLLSSVDHGAGMIDCLNAVPITNAIFGNHEDDVPYAMLHRRVAEFRGCWINGNLGGFPKLPTHQVIELARPGQEPIRVGIIGVLSEDPGLYRRGSFGGHSIAPAQDAAMALGLRLIEREGCACVIAMTHQSLERDRALAAQREVRFTLVIGGHEHEAHLESVDGCTIIKAGADASHAAIVDLNWLDDDERPEVNVRMLDVRAYPPDESLAARVEHHMLTVRALKAATLMTLPPDVTLSSVGTRCAQTTLGTMICSRLRDALGAELCLLNGGGIRGNKVHRGPFTYGDLETELPFANEVVVVAIPGAVLREVVAQSRARAPVPSGGFLQVDDGVELDGTSVVRVGGAPLDEGRDYTVATVRLLLEGIDGIDALIRFARARPERVPPADSGRELKMVLIETFALDLMDQLGTFESVDTDGDGRVSADELRRAIADHARQPVPDLLFDELMRALGRSRS